MLGELQFYLNNFRLENPADGQLKVHWKIFNVAPFFVLWISLEATAIESLHFSENGNTFKAHLCALPRASNVL